MQKGHDREQEDRALSPDYGPICDEKRYGISWAKIQWLNPENSEEKEGYMLAMWKEH